MQLAVTDVERDHAGGPALQQDVGEPARRCAEIETVEPGRIDRQHIERVLELESRAGDVRRRSFDLEQSRLVDLLAGLRMAANETGHHQRLGLRPALGQAALDEQDVEPLSDHEVRAASPATISDSTEVSALISTSRA